jgi:hypothetical protein
MDFGLFIAAQHPQGSMAAFLEEKYRVYVQWGQNAALPSDDSIDVPFEELQETVSSSAALTT